MIDDGKPALKRVGFLALDSGVHFIKETKVIIVNEKMEVLISFMEKVVVPFFKGCVFFDFFMCYN